MATNSLPEIPKARQGLVEAAVRPPVSALHEDSGLELRGSSLLEAVSRPSTAASINSSGRCWGVAKSPPGSARFTPSPPQAALEAGSGAARPRSTLGITHLRKSVEYVHVSRSELERKKEALNSLRCEVSGLQGQLRGLQHADQEVTKLQNVCEHVGSALGCSVGGVAATALEGILLTRVKGLMEEHKQMTIKLSQSQSDLEQCRGELAASKVTLTTSEDTLKKTRKEVKHLEAELKQTKDALELSKASCARLGASMESLRQQLADARGRGEEEERQTAQQLTQLQTDTGRLSNQLAGKEEQVQELQGRLKDVEREREDLRERLADSETMQMELCVQLAATLQLDPNTSLESDQLLSQVGGVVEECQELRLQCETLASGLKTAELDCKAGRETILRLVAEGKRQEQGREEVVELKGKIAGLEGAVEQQRGTLRALEQEKAGLQERITAGKETMEALQKQLDAKEEKIAELCGHLDASRFASDSEKSQVVSIQSQYDELVNGLCRSLSTPSADTAVLMGAIHKLKQQCSAQRDQLHELESRLSGHAVSMQSLQDAALTNEQALKGERAKVKGLEGEVAALEGVRDGMQRDLEKWQVFGRKLTRAVALEKETAQILTSGSDFAHDAILMKAEQLAKLESEALVSKQTAVYAMQRKLKTCKQSLLSKELHMNLLQKKVESMEHDSKTSTHMQRELDQAHSKMKQLEMQIERLQEKVGQQHRAIQQLETTNTQLLRTKEKCASLESRQASLVASRDELEGRCRSLSQQVSEARLLEKQRRETQGKETQELRAQLEYTCARTGKLQEREQKLAVFKSAVERLLLSYQQDSDSKQDSGSKQEGESNSSPSDYDLIATLEHLIGSLTRQRANSKCLEASLRQLEMGFKNSYKDTLTLLANN